MSVYKIKSCNFVKIAIKKIKSIYHLGIKDYGYEYNRLEKSVVWLCKNQI